MSEKRPKMDFEKTKQVFRFEISRFPFAPEERQARLRRAYRELEAAFRGAIRELEFDWGDPRRMPPRVLSARLGKIYQDFKAAREEYGHLLSPEMQDELATLCEHVLKLKECVNALSPEVGLPLKELIRGFEELKRVLGTVHRL
jgi:hypothetical protein